MSGRVLTLASGAFHREHQDESRSQTLRMLLPCSSPSQARLRRCYWNLERRKSAVGGRSYDHARGVQYDSCRAGIEPPPAVRLRRQDRNKAPLGLEPEPKGRLLTIVGASPIRLATRSAGERGERFVAPEASGIAGKLRKPAGWAPRSLSVPPVCAVAHVSTDPDLPRQLAASPTCTMARPYAGTDTDHPQAIRLAARAATTSRSR